MILVSDRRLLFETSLLKFDGKLPQSVSASAMEILHGIKSEEVGLPRFSFYLEGYAMKVFILLSNPDYFFDRIQ